MVVNQLFTEPPTIEFINKFVSTIGLCDIHDSKVFTFLDMTHHNTIAALKPLHEELIDIYLPCKQNYVTELTHKNIITILRQMLKVLDHDILSKEKFIKGSKYIEYKIVTKYEKENAKIKPSRRKKKKDFIIDFD